MTIKIERTSYFLQMKNETFENSGNAMQRNVDSMPKPNKDFIHDHIPLLYNFIL